MPLILETTPESNTQSYLSFLTKTPLCIRLSHSPATETEPEQYTIRIDVERYPNNPQRSQKDPLYHPRTTHVYTQSNEVVEMNSVLGQRCIYKGTTPMEAFLSMMRAISGVSLVAHSNQNRADFGLDHHRIPDLKWDLLVDWCYEQFGQPSPSLVTPSSSPLVRRKP